jgi:type IV pilus assembly protein PilB
VPDPFFRDTIHNMTIEFDEDKSQKKLAFLHRREEEELANMLSQKYGIPYADLTTISIDADGLKLMPEETARTAKMAIFQLTGKKLKIAILSPNRDYTQSELKKLEDRGYIVQPYMVSTQSLERAWDRYKEISFATETRAGSLDISSEEISDLVKNVHSLADIRNLIQEISQMKRAFRISRIVETIVAGAIALDASDIHVEPEAGDVGIRFRLDGVLVEITRLDSETYKLLQARIKLLSGMKLNIKNAAQDGRFSVKIGDVEIEIRASMLPGAYGESIVMRLLNPSTIQIPFEALGIPNKLRKIFIEELQKPNGMILNTGPTGSGKTTTLYSFMRMSQTPEVKIITIEDPIEYHLAGVVQTQVDKEKNYDFASGLKHSLRQDPDVIMVGEIRDLETAETAVHAALTGHLVFSTLHTNNAAGTFPRLIDLGVNPRIITSAINIAIAQRLVRKLCPHCRKEVQADTETLSILKNTYNSIPDPEIPFTEKIYVQNTEGCDKCHNGYKGRIGVFEAIRSDKAVEDVLQGNPSEIEIKKAAEAQGIMDMAQDGTIKILQGMTTFEEVQRVVDIKNRSGRGYDTSEMNIVNPDFQSTITQDETIDPNFNLQDFVK